VQHAIEGRTGQVTIGKLALFRIAELRVPLPPLIEQQEFERRLRMVESSLDAARRGLLALESLNTSLRARAFSGAL
jgi:restriction endonuclease S subunit